MLPATWMPTKAQVSDLPETNYVWKIDLIWEGSFHMEEKSLWLQVAFPGNRGPRARGLGLIVFSSVSPFMSVSICFLYLGTPMLGMLMRVIAYPCIDPFITI